MERKGEINQGIEVEKQIENNTELVVVVDSLNVGSKELIPFVQRILDTTAKTNTETQIMLSMHRGLDPNSDEIDWKLREEFPNMAKSVIVDNNTFAYSYLKGLQSAINLGDKVIELDSGGGHKPEEITRFIEGLDNYDIVLSSRFMHGGTNTYPLQRKFVSRSVTIMSNMFLDTKVTDAASGFQGFRSEVLKDLFDKLPPEEWVSAQHGPFHMYQTEMMAMLAMMEDYSQTEVPITYGSEKKGTAFPVSYIAESLVCFFRIAEQKERLKQKFE